MKKLKLVALSLFSVAFMACEPEENNDDNNNKTNVASHEGSDRDISYANVAFGANINSVFTLFLDLHDGDQANSWSGGTFMVSFGVNGSDSLVIEPGTYTYNAQGGVNTFSSFQLIVAEGGDTNTFMATAGTLEIEESAHEGNYKLSFDVDTQHNMHAEHSANLTGNYSGTTQYYSIKGIENE